MATEKSASRRGQRKAGRRIDSRKASAVTKAEAAERFRRTRKDHQNELAEDYVEVIAGLIASQGEARVVAIAESLGVSHVTVNRTIARLQKQGLVSSQPYRAVFLTDRGEDLARVCEERHRIVVAFLCLLGVPEEVAALDAEGIEHHVSKTTLEAFLRFVESRKGKPSSTRRAIVQTSLLLVGTFLWSMISASGAAADRPDTIETDRPDFTEASSTVGKGTVQLESGYTFSMDSLSGAKEYSHSFPEALLRVGVLHDDLELRLAGNLLGGNSGVPNGVEDLYIGTKIALLDEAGIQPELAVILQADIPTGARRLSSRQMLPGISFLYGWDINESLSIAGSSQVNRRLDELGDEFAEYAQSVTTAGSFTDSLGAYLEWFAFFPMGASAATATPTHYINGGPTWRLGADVQLDARAGFGLTSEAADFFSGVGASFRW